MPQPQPFERAHNFTDEEAAAPNRRPSGVAMDTELDAIEVSIAGIRENLAKLQRDDGRLKNALVDLDSMTPATVIALGAGGWTVRGDWNPGTNYAVGDVVTNLAGTWLCKTAHKSGLAGLQSANFMTLWDATGTTPSDFSVTALKIAAGAVEPQHLGFDDLDLPGTIRGQGGVSAGVAPPGSLFHAKLNAGDAIAKVERNTLAQGAVGVDIITGNDHTWRLGSPLNNGDLFLSVDGVPVSKFGAGLGFTEFLGVVRATADFAANEGAQLEFAGGVGYVTAFDYTDNQWRDLRVRGKDVILVANGTDVLKATATYIDALVPLRLNGSAIGYLGIPQNTQAGAYVLQASDVGKGIYSENGAGQTITVPKDVFGTDAVITIVNDGAGNIILQPAAGVTLRLAGSGTTGARTIAPGGWAAVKCVKANRFFVGGVGVS